MKKQLQIFSLTVSLLFFSSFDAFSQMDFAKVSSDTFSSILKKCGAYFDQNNFDSAIIYAKNLKIHSDKEFGELSEHSANVLYLLAEIYRTKEDYSNAYYFFKSTVDLFTQIKLPIYDSIVYVGAVARVGFMLSELGANDEAMIYCLKAIELNKKLNLPGENVRLYIPVAELLVSKGEYSRADSMYMTMKETLDTLPKSDYADYLRAAIYANRGKIYSETGNLKKTIEYTCKALELEKIAKAEGYGTDYIPVLLNLAQVYALDNQVDSAWKKCKEAEDSLPAKSGILYAKLLETKACINQQRNNLLLSIDLYLKYQKSLESLPVKPDGFDANLVNLGILYTDTKQYNKADSLFRKQIAHLRSAGLEYSFAMQQSVAGLCTNLILRKKYTEAADSLIMLANSTFIAMQKNLWGMSESEKLMYENALDQVFDLLYICMQHNETIKKDVVKQAYYLELQHKGVVLATQKAILEKARTSADTTLQTLYRSWIFNRQILAKQYSLPFDQRLFRVDSLEEINEIIEKKVSAASRFISVKESNLTPVIPPAKKKRVFSTVQFVRFSYNSLNKSADSSFYAAFVTTSRDTVPVFVKLCNEKQLLQLMKDKHGTFIDDDQLTQKIYDSSSQSSKALYRLIWKPVERYLKGEKNINYSTSGILNNIALNAIYDGKDFLINRFTLRHYFSLKEVSNQEEVLRRPKAVSIWGNMNYDEAIYPSIPLDIFYKKSDSTFSIVSAGIRPAAAKKISKEPLQPFSTNEPLQLRKIFSGKNIKINSYENSIATEDKFKQQTFNTEGVVHISTHGFYTPLNPENTKATLPGNFMAGIENPLFRCGLAFSGVNYYWMKGVSKNNHDDGILTGYEVAQLDLSNVQLVTLSACETGLGDVTDNEGNLGLQRAFKMAGAQNLLVSLWQVPAKHTAELLSLFYTNWLQGQTLNEALRNAQLSMKKKYKPYFWAGFTLIK